MENEGSSGQTVKPSPDSTLKRVQCVMWKAHISLKLRVIISKNMSKILSFPIILINDGFGIHEQEPGSLKQSVILTFSQHAHLLALS